MLETCAVDMMAGCGARAQTSCVAGGSWWITRFALIHPTVLGLHAYKVSHAFALVIRLWPRRCRRPSV